MASWGATRYAKRDGAHIAHRVSDGEGPVTIGMMPGFVPLSCISERFARPMFDSVATFGRSILVERRGVGESDPIDLDNPPTLDDLADDLVAVLDHAEIDVASVWGFYTAGLVAIRAATRHPDRFSKLAVMSTYVRWEAAADLEGVSEYYQTMWRHEVEHGPDDEIDLLAVVGPSVANDDDFRSWWADVGRRGASPGTALALGAAETTWDIGDDLERVTCPTIVVHRPENRFVPASHGRQLAERIPGAQLVEAPGIDFLGLVGDIDALWDPVLGFFTSRPPRRSRHLAAVLFTDLVDSTSRSAAEGDRRWARLIEAHNEVTHEIVTSHDGELIKSTGDGVLAVFPSPASAIDAARAIQRRLEGRELEVRAGVHAGEIERLKDDVTGIAVTIAARVMTLAGPGEVLVSGAVPPLVMGSDLEFAPRGDVELKGVPGTWSLFSAS